jgi:hypothetical protein
MAGSPATIVSFNYMTLLMTRSGSSQGVIFQVQWGEIAAMPLSNQLFRFQFAEPIVRVRNSPPSSIALVSRLTFFCKSRRLRRSGSTFGSDPYLETANLDYWFCDAATAWKKGPFHNSLGEDPWTVVWMSIGPSLVVVIGIVPSYGSGGGSPSKLVPDSRLCGCRHVTCICDGVFAVVYGCDSGYTARQSDAELQDNGSCTPHAPECEGQAHR